MWVARDSTGALFLYEEKPIKKEEWGCWEPKNMEKGNYEEIDEGFFRKVQWSDKEPTELIIKR